jgi:hypothetical protein
MQLRLYKNQTEHFLGNLNGHVSLKFIYAVNTDGVLNAERHFASVTSRPWAIIRSLEICRQR